MALDKLTIIDGGGLSTTSDYRVGVITATKFVGPIEGAITSTDATFTGNVTIGGTLTYEDVTNIDSVGLVTARDGIFVPDDKSIRIGNTFANPDLKIFSSPTYEQAVIDYTRSGTGRGLRIRSTNTQIENWNGLAPIAKFVGGVGVGHVELNYAGDKKFETTTKGIQVGTGVTFETNGQGTFSGIVTSRGYEVSTADSTPTHNYFKAGRIKIWDNGSHLHFRGGEHPSYAPTQRYFSTVTERTNAYSLQNTAATRYGITWNNNDGPVHLYYSRGYAPDYSIKLSTHSGGVLVSGVTTTTNLAVTGVSTFTGSIGAQGQIQSTYDHASQPRLYLSGISGSSGYNYLLRGDNDAGSKAVHFVNGSARSADNGANTYTIRNDHGKLHLGKTNQLAVLQGSTIDLVHGSSTKLQTTSYGVIVDPASSHTASSASPARLSLGGTYSNTTAITTKPKLTLWENDANNDAMGFQITGNLLSVHLSKTEYDFAIYSAGSAILTVDSGDNETNYSYNHDLNLFANSNKSGVIRFNNFSPAAAGPNKIILWEAPTWSGGFGVSTDHIDYYSGHTHCFYTGTTTSSVGNIAAEFIKNGAVELYHNGTKKFETTSAGADFSLSSGGQVNLYHLGSDGGLRISGPQSSSSATLFFNTNHQNVSGGTDYYTITCGGANHTLMFKRGDMSGTTVLELDDTQHVRIPQDGKALKIGASQDLQLLHTGTYSNIYNATGDLDISSDVIRLKNGNRSETFAAFINNGQAELYYDNSRKFNTSPSGITVTGEVAASQDYPQSDPNIDFIFTKAKKLDPRLTYRRSGTASYVDKNGMLKMVGDNVPRFDHDPVTKECKGLLLEPAAVNRMSSLESEWANLPYFILTTNSNINSEKCGFSADTLAPDGSKWTLRISWEQSFSSNGYVRVGSSNIGTINAGNYTASFFVKRGLDGNHNLDSLLDGTSGVGSNQYHWAMEQYSPSYAASNASIKTSTTGIKIQKFQNGWYRISVPVTISNTFNPQRTGVSHYILNAGSHENYWPAMDFYYWGFQFEAGSEVTSFMGTASQYTNSTNTGYGNNIRGADCLFMDGQDFKDFYNKKESSIVMQYTLLGGSTYQGQSRAFKISAQTGSDTRIDYVNDNYYHPYIAGDGSAVVGGTGLDAGTTLFDGQTNKIAIKVKHQDFASTINGGTVVTNTSGSWPPTNKMDILTLGALNKDGGGGLKGHIQRFTYYPVGLTNNQLVTLTS